MEDITSKDKQCILIYFSDSDMNLKIGKKEELK